MRMDGVSMLARVSLPNQRSGIFWKTQSIQVVFVKVLQWCALLTALTQHSHLVCHLVGCILFGLSGRQKEQLELLLWTMADLVKW